MEEVVIFHNSFNTVVKMQKRIISAVKGVEFVSDRMSYTIPIGRWCHMVVLNIHAPTEEKKK
jgi:hypothetical protein